MQRWKILENMLM